MAQAERVTVVGEPQVVGRATEDQAADDVALHGDAAIGLRVAERRASAKHYACTLPFHRASSVNESNGINRSPT